MKENRNTEETREKGLELIKEAVTDAIKLWKKSR
jgi:hypothetical protein